MLAERGASTPAGSASAARARDHAVPHRPRRSGRGAPLGLRDRHDTPRHRADLRRPCLACRRAHGGSARPRESCERGSRVSCPSATPSCTSPTACPASISTSCCDEATGLGRATAPAHRRHHQPRPGRARGGRARHPRGRPGHAPRPRPRHLPVRHLEQPRRRRRLHRWWRRAAPDRARDRHHQGLLDARRLRAVPDRARRRGRPLPAGEGPRVRHHHRTPAPLWLARRGAAALLGRGQQRQRPDAQQARHPQRHARAPHRYLATASTGDEARWPLPLEELQHAEPVYEELPGWEEDISGSPQHRATCRPTPSPTSRPSRSLAGVPVAIVSVGPERTQTIIRRELQPRAQEATRDRALHAARRWRSCGPSASRFEHMLQVELAVLARAGGPGRHPACRRRRHRGHGPASTSIGSTSSSAPPTTTSSPS